MNKNWGFTIIELLVVMTISLILAIITVPSMMNWYRKDKFIQQYRDTIDAIYDTRAAAFSDKRCSNGTTSKTWSFVVKADIKTVSMVCHDVDGGSNEESEIILDENIVFPSHLYFQVGNNHSWVQFLLNEEASINFSSGNDSSHIIVDDSVIRGDYDIQKIQFPFEFADDSSLKRTICFDRIENFPTISSTSDCDA